MIFYCDLGGQAGVYCAKTLDHTWVGYRWYRFVDQPGLQQVGLSKTERSFTRRLLPKKPAYVY